MLRFDLMQFGDQSPVPLRRARTTRARGTVFLVGCGPGDPDLLTVRALNVLRAADVIVYDHLVSDAVLALARADAKRIYVGKERGRHVLPQEQINFLLMNLVRSAKCVARLKGGDPFVFGRGGEELQALAAEGIAVEVVPGITAACGIAASTGVPLTHREYAQSCVLVTGHLKDGTMDLDWEGLARPAQTIVVYMGLKGLPVLARELIAHGLPASTPAMLVEQGTTAKQRVLVATLATLPALAAEQAVSAPTLIIVGDVVRVRASLQQNAAHTTIARALAG